MKSKTRMTRMEIGRRLNRISYSILGGALAVHKSLGPGLLEHAYEASLAHELKLRGHNVETQVRVPVQYRGIDVANALRLDLLVDRAVVVEVKSIAELHENHRAQVLTYLHWTGCRLGMMFNFRERRLIDGFHRLVQ